MNRIKPPIAVAAITLLSLCAAAPAQADENDYADILERYGLSDLLFGYAGPEAIREACGLVPAVGALAAVDKISADYRISVGEAGRVVVAASEVCPEITPYLGHA